MYWYIATRPAPLNPSKITMCIYAIVQPVTIKADMLTKVTDIFCRGQSYVQPIVLKVNLITANCFKDGITSKDVSV